MSEDRRFHGMTAHEISDPAELASIGLLRSRMSQVSAGLKEWERIARVDPNPRSEIGRDDEVTAWWNLSHAVTHQINHAADTLRTLAVLIPPEGELSIPYISHFPVARSGLEAASLALWTLAPDDPKERVLRHLRNAWRELSEETSFASAILDAMASDPSMGSPREVDLGRKQHKAWRSKRVKYIRGVAQRLGLEDPTQSSWTVGFAEIIRGASEVTGLPAVYGEVVWRELSGLSHPSMTRSVRSMSQEELVDHGDGTLGVIFTSDTAKIRYSLEATHLHFLEAVRAFAARKIRIGDPAAYTRRGQRL